jgi:hypothetical protein
VAPPQGRRAPYSPWRASAKSRLERVRLCQRLGQILVILTVLTAKLLDRRQLLSGEPIVALDDIRLPKILAHLRVVGIERNRLEIVSNPFVPASKLAGRITARVERARSVRIVQKIEDIDRFLIAVSLGERIGVFSEIRGLAARCCVS